MIFKRLLFSGIFSLALSSLYAQDGQFLRAANTPTFDTDFTITAEKTVNSVVCIQSYVTPRQQYYSNPFSDFFDFFGFALPQQPQQQQPRKQQKQEP